MILMLGLFIYIDYSRTYERTEENSLQTAKILSHMDTVQDSISTEDQSAELPPIIDYYKSQVGASFIVIKDKNGQILTHPNKERVGQVTTFKDEFTAIVFGGFYSGISGETMGQAIVGVAPVYNDDNQIIGTVKVGFLVESLSGAIFERAKNLFYFSLFIFVLAILSSVLLARSIRKDTLGLEPEQIAAFYSERRAILSSISEGIIAIDASGNITLMNTAAKEILDLAHNHITEPIQSVIPTFVLSEQFINNEIHQSFELNVKDKILIMTTVPLRNGVNQKGAVITFKDKTETIGMVNRLFEVSKYSDNLRAQTHEFTNKLYVISGLLQLGKYDQAIQMIQEEIDVTEYENRIVFEHIKDSNVQAIILGKMGMASEMKTSFVLDENSSLKELPPFIRTGALTIIIGNLIDNALEAVSAQEKREVSFFALDIGEDIIIEVTDNGPGIHSDLLYEVFKQGFSTKSEANHGFGLANVQKIVRGLGGDIQVTSDDSGTTFSVYIPKTEKVEGDLI
ncbi:ATP-binding protein [Sporosarcina sp. G11-34]|uniref:ATP-binding protein n=1 Tax=Sporosarcina sp. G11-34 TaxID=2849605 RepID=UPI0022A960F6|nr:sensor histidine kinase [Sporosarcina sp. G11-34]